MKTQLLGIALTSVLTTGHSSAAVELSPLELEAVTAGGASAIATASALGNNVSTITFTQVSSGIATISALELLEGSGPSMIDLPDLCPALPSIR